MPTELSLQEQKAKLILALRQAGIRDRRVLDAMERIPRESFVPEVFRAKAYENIPLPIEHGQTISQPFIVAYMAEALKVGPRDKVLELGTGSGYNAAILSQLCRRLYTIERIPELARLAKGRLEALGIHNIVCRLGDGTKGWPEQGTFDRIISTAAADSFPKHLIEQLNPGGIMVTPVESDSGEQQLIRATKEPTGVRYEELLAVRFVPLIEGQARES